MKPVLNNIFIKKDEEENKTASGIFLTNRNDEPSHTATVVDAGKGTGEEVIVKKGDRIVYERGREATFKFKGEEYTLIKYQSIIGIL